MSATLYVLVFLQGDQRSQFQPRLHHRGGVSAAIQGAERRPLQRPTTEVKN